jgi:hypothetical protein
MGSRYLYTWGYQAQKFENHCCIAYVSMELYFPSYQIHFIYQAYKTVRFLHKTLQAFFDSVLDQIGDTCQSSRYLKQVMKVKVGFSY